MNRPFYLYLLILQKMSKRFYKNSVDPKIIGFPAVNKFFSFYHLEKKQTRIVLKELAKTGSIKIVPNRGIRIMSTEETEIIANQLPEWYTMLMQKYEKEMSRSVRI